MDTFSDMLTLVRSLPSAGNYFIHIDNTHRSRVKIFAPHGGCIEPCTGAIALAVAGNTLDSFVFTGVRKRDCFKKLHVTSVSYNEPQCLQLAEEADVAVAIHGCEGKESFIEIGGGNTDITPRLKIYLDESGYAIRQGPSHRKGEDKLNFINTAKQKGIQLELSEGFRRSLFVDYPKHTQRDPKVYYPFIQTLQQWFYELENRLNKAAVTSA